MLLLEIPQPQHPSNIAEYLYDRAGNLVSDLDCASITWTAYGYGKVRDVTMGSNVTKFRYDAEGHSCAGNRAVKSTALQATVRDYNKTPHYVRDASGNVLATAVQVTYINGVLSARNNSIAIGKDDEVKGSGND